EECWGGPGPSCDRAIDRGSSGHRAPQSRSGPAPWLGDTRSGCRRSATDTGENRSPPAGTTVFRRSDPSALNVPFGPSDPSHPKPQVTGTIELREDGRADEGDGLENR